MRGVACPSLCLLCSVGAAVAAYWPSFETLDLKNVPTTGSSLYGFEQGFTDGNYGYLVPNNGALNGSGKFVRISLSAFTLAGVQVLDLNTVDTRLVSFYGGFIDGTYAYLAPNRNGVVPRIDLLNWNINTVTMLDVKAINSVYFGFRGAFTDGTFGYLVPCGPGTWYGTVLRFALASFDPASVQVLDLALTNTNLKSFQAGFALNGFGYVMPTREAGSYSLGKVTRFSLATFDAPSVQFMDLQSLDTWLVNLGCGLSDGVYIYAASHTTVTISGATVQKPKVVRFPLSDFSLAAVSVLDLSSLDSDYEGFQGVFSSGTSAFFVPFNNGAIARVSLSDFSSVEKLDVMRSCADCYAFHGGFIGGGYGYLVPYVKSMLVRIGLEVTTVTSTTSSMTSSTTTTSSTYSATSSTTTTSSTISTSSTTSTTATMTDTVQPAPFCVKVKREVAKRLGGLPCPR